MILRGEESVKQIKRLSIKCLRKKHTQRNKTTTTKEINKQKKSKQKTNKQTNKQTDKQTNNKQRNKDTNNIQKLNS